MTIEELTAGIAELDETGIAQLAERTKPLQAHVDKRVQRAVETYAEKHGAPEPEKVISDRESKLDHRETLFNEAIARELPPATVLAMFDPEASIETRLDLLQEYREEAETVTKRAILKDAARNPRLGTLNMDPLSLEQIAELPDHVQAKLPPSVTEPALQAHIDKRKSIPSVRSEIRSRLFGSRK